MMGLLSDPLCSPGAGRKVSLVVGRTDDAGRTVKRAAGHENGGDLKRDEVGDGGGGEVVGGDASEAVVDEDSKVSAALAKALVLLEDADMMRRMLEKLLEFDEKKYTAMFQVGSPAAPVLVGWLLCFVCVAPAMLFSGVSLLSFVWLLGFGFLFPFVSLLSLLGTNNNR